LATEGADLQQAARFVPLSGPPVAVLHLGAGDSQALAAQQRRRGDEHPLTGVRLISTVR